MCFIFDLEEQDSFYYVTLSPSINSVNVLTNLRKDIWKKSEVQNIINTLNSQNLSTTNSDKSLEVAYSEAVNKELQRQCDVWNSKLS